MEGVDGGSATSNAGKGEGGAAGSSSEAAEWPSATLASTSAALADTVAVVETTGLDDDVSDDGADTTGGATGVTECTRARTRGALLSSHMRSSFESMRRALRPGGSPAAQRRTATKAASAKAVRMVATASSAPVFHSSGSSVNAQKKAEQRLANPLLAELSVHLKEYVDKQGGRMSAGGMGGFYKSVMERGLRGSRWKASMGPKKLVSRSAKVWIALAFRQTW